MNAMDDKYTLNRRARLRELIRDHFGGEQKQLLDHITKMTGKKANQGEISGLAKDHSARSFGDKKGRALAEQIGLSPDWFEWPTGVTIPLETWSHVTPLLHSPDSKQRLLVAKSTQSLGLNPIAVWEYPDDLPEGEYIQVPRLNVQLSAGHGRGEQLEIDLERANPQVFRAEWVRKERLKPSALASMYVRGDSMAPRLRDGDSVVVDTSQVTVIDGRVYALWYAGELRVKRLYKSIDGGLVIHSDNEADYPRMDAAPDQLEHIRIIGRVVHLQGTGGL